MTIFFEIFKHISLGFWSLKCFADKLIMSLQFYEEHPVVCQNHLIMILNSAVLIQDYSDLMADLINDY